MSDSEENIEQVEKLIKAIESKDTTNTAAILKSERNPKSLCSTVIRKGMTPLHAACLRGNKDILSQILKTGVDVNLKLTQTVRQGLYWFDMGSTPLHIAVSRQHSTEIVQTLLDNHADPRIDNGGEVCTTPLCIASDKGFLHTVKQLIDHKADVNWVDTEKRSALQRAAQNGHSAVVMLLLSEKADPNLRDAYGNTALSQAAKEGRIKTAVILVENRARVDLQNDEANTPLYHALVKDHVEIMAMLLIDHGANLNHQNRKGWTALHCAAIFGKVRAIQVLITEGADLNLKDKSGKTALHHACRSDLLNVVEILVEGGADIHLQDNNGKTPEEYSSRKDVKAALKKGDTQEIASLVPPSSKYGYVEEDELKTVKNSIKALESKVNTLNIGEDQTAELSIRLRHLKREVKRFKVKKPGQGQEPEKLTLEESVTKAMSLKSKPDITSKPADKPNVKAMFRKCASAIFYSNSLTKMVDGLKRDLNEVKSEVPAGGDKIKVTEFMTLAQSLAVNIQVLQEHAVLE